MFSEATCFAQSSAVLTNRSSVPDPSAKEGSVRVSPADGSLSSFSLGEEALVSFEINFLLFSDIPPSLSFYVDKANSLEKVESCNVGRFVHKMVGKSAVMT